MKYKDVLVRALKTFMQGFLASLVVSLQGQQTIDERLIKGALIGAIAGGISAVMNLIINYLDRELDREEENNDNIK